MTHLYLTLHTLTAALLARAVQLVPARARERLRDDAGLSTLEVVVLALGLFTLAGLVIAAITVAVMSRMNQIK